LLPYSVAVHEKSCFIEFAFLRKSRFRNNTPGLN
jgi:hypothetical protein